MLMKYRTTDLKAFLTLQNVSSGTHQTLCVSICECLRLICVQSSVLNLLHTGLDVLMRLPPWPPFM